MIKVSTGTEDEKLIYTYIYEC